MLAGMELLWVDLGAVLFKNRWVFYNVVTRWQQLRATANHLPNESRIEIGS